jgi:hypothetical protein
MYAVAERWVQNSYRVQLQKAGVQLFGVDYWYGRHTAVCSCAEVTGGLGWRA